MDRPEHTDLPGDPVVTNVNLDDKNALMNRRSSIRAQLEESELLDRVRATAAEINRKAGYHILELLEFLPPQRCVLRICFSKNRVDYILEILLRTNGPALVFHSSPKSEGLDRYFRRYLRAFRSPTAFKQYIDVEAVTDEFIQAWFSFLLSGFDKKFIPVLHSHLPARYSPRPKKPLDKMSA